MSQPPRRSYDPEEILDLGMAELGRRLEDDPSEISGPALVRMLDNATKAAERRREQEREAQAVREEDDALLVILRSPLPSRRKRELIHAEIEKLKAQILYFEGALEGDDPDE